MKKKTVKKLVLAKETVRRLEAEKLLRVGGAIGNDYLTYSCDCPSEPFRHVPGTCVPPPYEG